MQPRSGRDLADVQSGGGEVRRRECERRLFTRGAVNAGGQGQGWVRFRDALDGIRRLPLHGGRHQGGTSQTPRRHLPDTSQTPSQTPRTDTPKTHRHTSCTRRRPLLLGGVAEGRGGCDGRVHDMSASRVLPQAMRGEEVVQCAYVESTLTSAQYFASPCKFGPDGGVAEARPRPVAARTPARDASQQLAQSRPNLAQSRPISSGRGEGCRTFR